MLGGAPVLEGGDITDCSKQFVLKKDRRDTPTPGSGDFEPPEATESVPEQPWV